MENREGGYPLRPVHRLRPWALALALWAALVPMSIRPRHSGNVWSRYMTIESIVERGTMSVDRSPLRAISGSPDLIRVDGHSYSDKPPVLSAVAAIPYAALHALGWSFSTRADRTAGKGGGSWLALPLTRVNLVLVALLVGGSSALALVGLRRILQYAPLPPLASDLLTLAFGFTSPLLTYGVTFNNHSVAAGCLTCALALVLLGERPALAGLLAGFAAAVDLPAGGAMAAALAAWLAWRDRAVPWKYLLGCAGPLALHAALQAMVTGSPLPAEMTPRVFDYPGSYWLTEAGQWREPGPRWRWGLELLLGPQGWLTVTPALAVGLAAIARIAARRPDPLRPAALAVGLTVAVLVAYYTWGVRRTDFAGQSFGTRHLLPVAPAVYALAAIALGRLRSRPAWVAFALLLAIGAIYAYAGMLDPWTRIERRDDHALRLVKHLTLYPRSTYAR